MERKCGTEKISGICHWKYLKVFLVLTMCNSRLLFSQEVYNGYTVLYYPNGVKASEGYMKNGQPDGFWIAYYPTGIKKSEGNRKNFLLDSIWIFYNQIGDTAEKISYVLGKKNGYAYKYGYQDGKVGKDRVIILAKELYVNDIKEGISYYYEKNGKLREVVKYRKGKREGISFIYDDNNNLTEVRDYRNDFPVLNERINRLDSMGRKTGVWREYYPDGKIKMEITYKDGLPNGIMKQFNEKGILILSLLYKEGRIVDENPQLEKVPEMKYKMDENQRIVYSGAFIDDTIPVGIHRYFNNEGKVVETILYGVDGSMISKGIIDLEGKREGKTEFYYENGKIKAEGNYKNNLREGVWRFYSEEGKVEQEGSYRNGMENGLWTWYYKNGNIGREENYLNGKEDGEFVEYDENGNIITKGVYIEGEKEGEWFYKVGDHSEVGKYINGLRDGEWKYFYDNGNIQMRGKYVQGNLDGKVILYYEDGKVMEEQFYINGIKEKSWKKYDREGNVVLEITYREDEEERINGIKVKDFEREKKLIR